LTSEWDDYKKFAVVRNPVEIMKSFYAYAKKSSDYLSTPITDVHYRAYKYSQLDGTGPDGFVEYMLDRMPQSIWPQAERLAIQASPDNWSLVHR
jgi:hypothetical protein